MMAHFGSQCLPFSDSQRNETEFIRNHRRTEWFAEKGGHWTEMADT